MPRLLLATTSLIAAACAGPAEFVHRPKEPIAWPYADATPRVELELVYGGSQDVVRHPGFFAWLASVLGGENEVHFVSPAGMCHVGEMLWIADPGAACVHRLSFVSGEHLQFTGSTEHPFTTPIGVADAGDGGIYVTDSGTGYITQLTAEGNAARCFGGPELIGRPTGICFDPARRRLVVVDTTGCRLHVFDPELEPVASFGRVGRGPGDFANPKGVAVDAADRIWVVDSMFDNVQVFDPEGRLLLAVGSSGNADGQLYLPTGIHIDADGRIHVADAGNSRIQILLLKDGVQ